MSFKMIVAAALICAANAAVAASYTAVFETPALFDQFGGSSENPNDVVAITVIDTAAGVEIWVENTGLVDSIGSMFLSGLTAASFTSPLVIVDTGPLSGYQTQIGAGVVFGLELAPGETLVASTVAGSVLTATDIAAAIIGTITIAPTTGGPERLSLYRGAFEPARVGVVPLPATLPLLGAAMIGIAGIARRRH